MVIARKPAEPNPWRSKSLEWQLPTPVPVHNFDRIPVIDADPYDYGVPPVPPAPVPAGASGVAPYPEQEVNEMADSPDEAFAEPPEVQERNLWLGVRVMAGVTIMFFLAFVFAYFYLRSLNNGGRWRPPRRRSAPGLRRRDRRPVRAQRRRRSPTPIGPREAPAPGCRSAGIALALGLAGCVVQGFEYGEPRLRAPRRRLRERVPRLDAAVHGVRARRACTGWRSCSRPAFVIARTEAYVPHGLDAASFYWTLLAVIGVIAWVILYLL